MTVMDPARTLEGRFADLGAGLGRLLDKAEHSELADGLKAELKVWREWLDEARLQSALGSMEVRDRLAGPTKEIEHAYARLLKHLVALEELPDPAPHLTEAVQAELISIKEELASPKAFEA
jgi:hypothetical protein